MPLTYTRTFRVRHYECDAYGHLNNANYLRYMQETAFDASTAAGYSRKRYDEMGVTWWIRQTEIEYLHPLVYNDRVNVKTWVADFRRASSRRRYEFYRLEDEALVARGFSDWVFMRPDSGQLVKVPTPMVSAFFPEGVPAEYPAREPFPKMQPQPPGVFCEQRTVTWQDLDSAQHVNNAVYLDYVEQCGLSVVAAHGWPLQRMAQAGFGILVRKHQILYRKPALLDDVLELATWASDIRRSTATRHYTIQRAPDGDLLVEVHSLGVWVDLSSGRPIRIPPGFIEDFRDNIL